MYIRSTELRITTGEISSGVPKAGQCQIMSGHVCLCAWSIDTNLQEWSDR